MSHSPHTLADEFPESVERLHALKAADPRFSRLIEEYREVNNHIHRIETRVEPACETLETVLRRKRMLLKDQIYAGLKASFEKKDAG